ncbi:hypothetical protein QL285_027329 [Trifolium repens]|nr:hypothetical protein QL285_027329 [Trifolium repens]
MTALIQAINQLSQIIQKRNERIRSVEESRYSSRRSVKNVGKAKVVETVKNVGKAKVVETFFMLIDNNSNHERLSFFPPFHSLSTSLQHYRSFFMRIGVEDLTSTQLVLRQDLGNFLASTGHFRIKVSGPWDYVVTIRLIVNRENGRRVKFGQGWTTFCHLHQIASGNVLNFKAACTIEYSNILIVRIV